jgi:glycosyltransferase involved in cell wall biosynthesis
VRASKGQFILFTDDDDTVLPNRISSPLDFLLKNPDLDVVYCNFNLVDEVGIKPIYCDHFDENAYLHQKFNIGSGILLGRKRTFIDIPFMSIYDRAVDFDWVFRLVRRGYKIDLCPEIVMNYNRSGPPDLHLAGNAKAIKIHKSIYDREILLKSVERH